MAGLKERVYKRNHLKECCYCRVPLSFKAATVEHIIPQAYGGTGRAKNTTLACQLCNTARGDTFDIEIVEKNRNKAIRRQGLEDVRPLDPHWRVVKMWQTFTRADNG